MTCQERSGKAPSRSVWSTSRSSCTPRCAITGRSSGCCTRRTSRRSGSSASASATASRWPGRTSSRATSTRKGTSSSSRRKTSRRRRVEKTRTIDIIDFVKADEIDDRFFETPYYLRAGQGRRARVRAAARSDSRIRARRHRQVHPARRAASGGGRSDRQRARADDHAIRRRARRRRAQFEFPGDAGIRKPELDMAKALVNSLAAEWDPTKYTDQYRENLLRIIKAKVKGKKVDARGGRRAAAGRSRRPDGAPAPEPRAKRRPPVQGARLEPRSAGRRSARRPRITARLGSYGCGASYQGDCPDC